VKYFFVTFLISTFVIIYVWQNIEVMKIKMTYNRLLESEKVLADEQQKLRYEFEKRRNFENIKKVAGSRGFKQIEPEDVYFFKESSDDKGKSDKK